METVTTLREKLLSNPGFIVSYILHNNPNAVVERLRGMGFTVGNADQAFNAINALLEKGEGEKAVEALSVPMLTADLDPAEVAIAQEVAQAHYRASNAVSGNRQRDALQFDASNIFAGLATGFLTTYQLAGGNGPVKASPTSQVEAAKDQAAADQAKAKRTNTLIVVGGIVLVVVVVIIAVVISRKKK
jgi:hypothetical protein